MTLQKAFPGKPHVPFVPIPSENRELPKKVLANHLEITELSLASNYLHAYIQINKNKFKIRQLGFSSPSRFLLVTRFIRNLWRNEKATGRDKCLTLSFSLFGGSSTDEKDRRA